MFRGIIMQTRDIAIICITIIILVAIGVFAISSSNFAEDTILEITSDENLDEGDSLIIKLTDKDNKELANKTISINITDKSSNIVESFTLKTNSNGEAKVNNLKSGNFSASALFIGDKNYKQSHAEKDFNVKKIVTESSSSTSSTSDSTEYATTYKADEEVNGWDPNEHEVSREDLGDGSQRITYDDGYFRIVDKDGNILSYGY